MERLRYVGEDKERDIALPGGFVRVDRMKWFDLEALAEAEGIPGRHAVIWARDLGPDWEREGPVKAARTRKANDAAETADEENKS